MTREELMEDVAVGQIIKIYSTANEVFRGRVDSFGPSGLKIVQIENETPKRIMYERISEYDIENHAETVESTDQSTRNSHFKIDRQKIFNSNTFSITASVLIDEFEKEMDKADRSNFSKIQNILSYAKKIGEYNKNSDRVKKALAELQNIADTSPIFYLYMAAVVYDFSDFETAARYCYDCGYFEYSFYLYEKACDNENTLKAAVSSINQTKDSYIIKWLCEYAVKADNVCIIKAIVEKNSVYSDRALVYWYANSPLLREVENECQLYSVENISKLKKALANTGDRGKEILDSITDDQKSKINASDKNATRTGIISYYNKNGGNGYIKDDDGGTIYFYIKQVKDYNLQKILALDHNIKRRVTFIHGINHTGSLAADRIEMIDNPSHIIEYGSPENIGYIEEYDKIEEYGKIRSGNQSYNFQFNAINDPLLRADIEYSYNELELEVKFNLKSRMNKNKKKEEFVACDIVGTKQYSEDVINDWIKSRILSQKEVDLWLGKEQKVDETAWRKSVYKPLMPLSALETKRSSLAQSKDKLFVNKDDKEEEICNDLIQGIANPFVNMEKISVSGNYRDIARKYSIGLKTDDDVIMKEALEKAEDFFIKAIRADEQLRSTVPDLVNVYIRLGRFGNEYIIKGLQLLSVFGYLLPTETLMNLRVQLIDKGNDKKALEKILENSIAKCTKNNTKYHFMSKLAGLYLASEKYEQARRLFQKCAAFLKTHRNEFLNYEKMIQWPIRSVIIADYYDGNKDLAIENAKKFLISNPEDATIKSIVDGTIEKAQKTEILGDIVDSIPYINNTSNEQFILSELYSPYSGFMLEQCEYSQVRDRKYDEASGRYVWKPDSEDKANSVYDSLAGSSSIFGKDGELRPGTYEEVADKRLNMAKIAEYCLSNATELNLTSKKTTSWKGKFIWTTAHYMWLRSNTYRLKQNAMSDTSSYFLLECISIFFKDENYKLRYEFYDAINRFFILQSHLTPERFNQITIKKAENLNRRNVGQKKVDDEISLLETTISDTFYKIFSHNSSLAIKILGMIIESCNKEAITYLSKLFLDINSDIKAVLCSAHEEMDDYISNHETASLEDIFGKYAEILEISHSKLKTFFDEINNALAQGDLNTASIAASQIKAYLGRIHSITLSNTDIERCDDFINLLSDLANLKADATANYEIGQERASSIKNKILIFMQRYDEHPSRISHDILSGIMQIVLDIVTQISEEITLQSLPEITVEDEYEQEGYFPQNDRIDLMLLISNGRTGKQCTTASNIQLDIIFNDTLRKYILCEQTHFNLSESLAGGDKCSQQIKLHLTHEGAIPDTIFTIPSKVSYQTIKGTEECFEIELNIHIKSEDAFVEIPNLYDKKMIRPGSEMAKLFKGRASDIANISNKLLHGGRGKTVLVYGQFRSGKSSLVNFLVDEIENQNKSIITVDAGTVIDGENSWDIVNKISIATCEKLEDLGLLTEDLEPYIESQANADNYSICFLKFAKKLGELVSEKNLHILIKIDEFGRFFKNDLSNNFMQLWKSIMEMEVFDAILIGHDIVTQMIRKDSNSFGVINTYQVNYIDRDATEQLVTEPTRMKDQRTRFTDNAVQYIWEQSAGNVFYIQLICQAAIRFMNKRHINIVNEVYIKQAIEEWLNNDADENAYREYGHPLFLSGELGDDAAAENETIIVLDAITKNGNCATKEEIIKFTAEVYNLPEIKAITVLNSLRARRVIDQNEETMRFSIRSRFYPDFLNSHIIQSI